MPTLEVINACTDGNAKSLLVNPNCGRLAVGNKLRFILTEHQPLNSVSELRKNKIVVFDEHVFDSSEVNMAGF